MSLWKAVGYPSLRAVTRGMHEIYVTSTQKQSKVPRSHPLGHSEGILSPAMQGFKKGLNLILNSMV